MSKNRPDKLILVYLRRFDEKFDRLSRLRPADGHLYLGGAETVLGICDKLQPLPENRGVYVPTPVPV